MGCEVKIRFKIVSGFMILAVMLAAAGAYSIYELRTIGLSVQRLLDDNYKSITAAKQMLEALEREDSGILLLLLGKWREGRTVISEADGNFRQALEVARHNVTIAGELSFIEEIDRVYQAYQADWNRPIVDTQYEGNLSWYFERVHRDFLAVKSAVQGLAALNDKTMYQTASSLKNRAHQAVMPGIVAMSSALILALIFNFLINLYFVNPVLSVIGAIEKFLRSGEPVNLSLETNDEMQQLATAVKNLSIMAETARRSAGHGAAGDR